jgi:hypothetical protein
MSAPARRVGGILAVCVALGLGVLLLLLEAGQPVHIHHGATPGFFDGECALASLTASHVTASLPSPAAPASTGIVASAVPIVVADPVAGLVLRPAHPRAPPLG